LAPLQAFLASLGDNPPGIDHELLFIFKGFIDGLVPDDYQAAIGATAHRVLFVPDVGPDIRAYLTAAAAVTDDYLCFLNSFSLIQAQDWLAKMFGHVMREGVGVVGATGSWESWYTMYLQEWRSNRRPGISRARLRSEMTSLGEAIEYRRRFAAFPNPHIRSNALLISRRLLLSVPVGRMTEKKDGHDFESGRRSLTRQLLARGLRPLVIDRHGRAHEKEEWDESLTFRSGEQQNLLVADNQTRQYAAADAAIREFMTNAAWGRKRIP
jgi:hypothetical protein